MGTFLGACPGFGLRLLRTETLSVVGLFRVQRSWVTDGHKEAEVFVLLALEF